MKKVYTYSAIVLLLGLTACNKTESFNFGSDEIRFAPASVETRALIETKADLRSQTFQVYDYLTTTAGTTEHINNTIAFNATTGWTYGTAATYKWADGTHKFFGFTSGAGSFGSNTLSVSKTLTTAEADQVDLLYSDIYSTTAADWKSNKTAKDSVMLNFHHLLSAVSFIVTNTTTNQVVLNSVDVKIPNKGSATVNYAGDDEVVTYGEVTTDGDFITATPLSDLTISQDQLVDVLTQAVVTDTLYQVVWPQEFENDGDLVVNVSYTMTIPATDTEPAVSSTFNSNVKIPAAKWLAGNRYVYTLQITPSDIQLIFKVMPWDEGQAGDIDTSTGSINMTNVTWMNTKVDLNNNSMYGEILTGEFPALDSLGHEIPDSTVTKVTLNENTVVNGDYAVYMYYNPYVLENNVRTQYEGYFPAMGYFTVNYPTSGKFKIGLIPAYGKTTVDKSKYEIYIWNGSAFRLINSDEGETITEETVYFQVRATSSVPAQGDLTEDIKAQIDIWFKPEGSDEWISAYSEIRANYALTIPKSNAPANN